MNDKLKLDKKAIEVLKLEYEQSCEDWRNRDSMIWQALALLVAISGAAFSFSFNANLDFSAKLIALIFTIILSFLAMIKIVKDHYYQKGSQKYLSKLSEKLCGMNHKDLLDNVYHENCEECKIKKNCKVVNPRHHNCDYESYKLELFGIKCTSDIYKKITEISAFKVFYSCNLLIILLTFLLIFRLIILKSIE